MMKKERLNSATERLKKYFLDLDFSSEPVGLKEQCIRRLTEQVRKKLDEGIIQAIREHGYDVSNHPSAIREFAKQHKCNIEITRDEQGLYNRRTLYIDDKAICKWSERITPLPVGRGDDNEYVVKVIRG